MKIVYNKFIPFKGFIAVNLFGVMFVREEYRDMLRHRTVNHEMIHTAQMKELFYIGFYIWYLVEYLIWLLRYLDTHKAYRSISFEREAYRNEKNFHYLRDRKHFAWLRRKLAPKFDSYQV